MCRDCSYELVSWKALQLHVLYSRPALLLCSCVELNMELVMEAKAVTHMAQGGSDKIMCENFCCVSKSG